MAKTRILQSTRDHLLIWMTEQMAAKLQLQLEKPELKAIEAANKAIRAKYPEKDMEVLRKYKCTRRDNCLRFVSEEGQVFGVDFGYEEQKRDRLADMPDGAGCHRGDVFPVTKTVQNTLEAYIEKRDANKYEAQRKRHEYFSFLAACKTVEEVDEVVKLPDDLRKRYLSGGALVAINPDVVASIKSDFKPSNRS